MENTEVDTQETEVVEVEPQNPADTGEVERLRELVAENERLRATLSETRQEAAKYRIGRREAVAEKATVEERLSALEQERDRALLEAERTRFLKNANLPDDFAELLGDDPAVFQKRADMLSQHIQSPVEQEHPVGVERLTGGLTPAHEEPAFDPQAIIRKHRRR